METIQINNLEELEFFDNKYYKKHNHYDFPQKELKFKVLNAIFTPLWKMPSMRKRMQQDMNKFMVKPFEKYIQ